MKLPLKHLNDFKIVVQIFRILTSIFTDRFLVFFQPLYKAKNWCGY